ncbi:HEAT repeat domain-containing protein [Bdellovibrio sp. HCB2-146]|uniref:HEAT repeat domain-containing protein n=1 Tax=Bdellovibrio sp. HCB2-146 TaxID=3394362 RepID=UPI0039BCB380
MKFNTLRYLVLPWFLLFCAIIASMIVEGTVLHLDPVYHDYYVYVLAVGVFMCLFSNLQTLTKAGIWLAHSLPSKLRHNPWGWFARALVAALIAYGFYEVGKMSWAPLIWQGAVIPVAFTICLFVVVWSLMGPLLSFCSRVAFSRLSAFVLSWPIFILVPITAVFLGRTIVTAYNESRPDFALTRGAVTTVEAPEEVTAAPTEAVTITAKNKVAVELQEAVATGQACNDKNKLILANLTTNGDSDVVYWAVRAVKCSDMKAVVGLPKLADIMLKHKDPTVRAAAIDAMPKFGTENVKRIGYLLVKRLSESEDLQVSEAAAGVLLKLGDEERAWVSKRLTSLLDNPKTSALASKILAQKLKREDLVSEFVAKNLAQEGTNRRRAISMVCSLSEQGRKIAEPHIDAIVSSIKTGDTSDPAVKALECLGHPGLEALRKEIATPTKLQKDIAARAFAQASWKEEQAVLETASTCVRDSEKEVRHWCSEALGKAGAPAVPGILELLMSHDPELKSAATHALSLLKDPEAKQELLKVRAANSGWMARQKDLEVARAIDKALANMGTAQE